MNRSGSNRQHTHIRVYVSFAARVCVELLQPPTRRHGAQSSEPYGYLPMGTVPQSYHALSLPRPASLATDPLPPSWRVDAEHLKTIVTPS